MSSSATIAIVIVAIVVLAGIVFVTTARRADVRGAGALSRETVKRDKAASKGADSTVRRGCLFMSTRRTLGKTPVPIREGISRRW